MIHGFIHIVEVTDTLRFYVHVGRSTSQHSFLLENILGKTFFINCSVCTFKFLLGIVCNMIPVFVTDFLGIEFLKRFGKLQITNDVSSRNNDNCDKLCCFDF